MSFSNWLTSLSIIHSRSSHAVPKGEISFFFNGLAVFHRVNVPQPFYSFICDGHRGCFQILATADNAAVNTGHMCSSELLFLNSWDIFPEVESLGHKAVPFLNFEETSHCFPQWLHQSAFPPTVQEGSPLSTASPALAVC